MVNNMVVSVPISSIVGRINRIGKHRIDMVCSVFFVQFCNSHSLRKFAGVPCFQVVVHELKR